MDIANYLGGAPPPLEKRETQRKTHFVRVPVRTQTMTPQETTNPQRNQERNPHYTTLHTAPFTKEPMYYDSRKDMVMINDWDVWSKQ